MGSDKVLALWLKTQSEWLGCRDSENNTALDKALGNGHVGCGNILVWEYYYIRWDMCGVLGESYARSRGPRSDVAARPME